MGAIVSETIETRVGASDTTKRRVGDFQRRAAA
jgi:hypothetical protein